MKEQLKSFFEEEKIEYYAVLPYSACREINRGIMERESFTPRSVILYLLPYYTGECLNISRYAASLDYHIAIREVNGRLSALLKSLEPECNLKGYGDHSPIDECGAALLSGLAIRGDSGLIINEKYGTFVFIGDLVTDIAPELLGATEPKPVGECLHCRACLSSCPTGILRSEGEDCLSAITQRKGELTEEEVNLMRKFNTVWGCDVCQEVCPYNKERALSPLEFFYRERLDRLTTETVEQMTVTEFSRRAFAWRGLKTVLRNLSLLDY